MAVIAYAVWQSVPNGTYARGYIPIQSSSGVSTPPVIVSNSGISNSLYSQLNGNNPSTLAVGELLNVTLLITVQPGQSPQLVLYNYINSTVGHFQALNMYAIEGSYINTTFSAATLSSFGSYSQPDLVTYNFGNTLASVSTVINNNPSASLLGRQIQTSFQLYVPDISSNVNGLNMTVQTRMYSNGTSLAVAPLNSIIVVEPLLNATLTGNTTSGQGNDAVIFTLTVSHTSNSTADAYNLFINNPMLPKWMLVPGTVTCTSGCVVVTGNANTDTILSVTFPQLVRGNTFKVQYVAKLAMFSTYNSSIITTTTVDYKSINTALARSYPTLTPVFTFTTPALSAIGVSTTSSGSIHATSSASIGEIITLTTVISLPVGTAPSLLLHINISSGVNSGVFQVLTSNVTYGANVTSSTSIISGTYTDNNGDGYYETIDFNLGTVSTATYLSSSADQKVTTLTYIII